MSGRTSITSWRPSLTPVLLLALTSIAGCGARGATAPPARTSPATPPETASTFGREEFLQRLFAAVVAHDPSALDALGDPEREWKDTLECPPRNADFDADRSRYRWVVERTKDVHLDLAGIDEDKIVVDLAQGQDDGFGCRAKVGMQIHRLVLRVSVTTAKGDSHVGSWTLQATDHDGAWHLTSDVTRLHL